MARLFAGGHAAPPAESAAHARPQNRRRTDCHRRPRRLPGAASLGPAEDRVGLPDYAKGFTVLRTFYGAERQRVGVVYANERAASVGELGRLPYPHGSIFLVEWHSALLDEAGAPLRDAAGQVRGGPVIQIDVMRREPGFGAAYGSARTGDWEFVSYRPDGSHFVAPAQSGQCAACHLTAGADRDFVFRGRFPPRSDARMN